MRSTDSKALPGGHREYPYRRRVLQMAVVLLIMLDTLRRIFADSPLINFLMVVVELLVLGFVGYEVIQAICHRVSLRRFVQAAAAWIEKGRHLQQAVPVGDNGCCLDYEKAQKWEKDIEEWIVAVKRFLSRHSSSAVSAFDLITPLIGERMVYRSDGRFTPVVGKMGNEYQVLETRLENLRRIMESAETYI